jgi:hypothetical protein
VLAKGEDVSVMKIDDSGELGGRGRGTTRSDDGDENLWHEELHERRVHHQSAKGKNERPFTGDERFNGGKGGNRGGGFGAELGGVEVCTCESKRDRSEHLHGLSKASEEEGEAEGSSGGKLAIDG